MVPAGLNIMVTMETWDIMKFLIRFLIFMYEGDRLTDLKSEKYKINFLVIHNNCITSYEP